MTFNHSQKAFLELVKAGLWEKEAHLSQFGDIDFAEVYRLAEEQSVQGLVLAGIEHSDVRPPQDLLLQWIGEVQMIEQQNKAMNVFVAQLIDILRNQGVDAILVKGQGIAQCYERPLWRASGDVDLLLSDDDYERAKELLVPLASEVEVEYTHFKHSGMTINGWVVELHGTLHSRLSKRVDNGIDAVQRDLFYGGKVKSWDNGGTQVLLPAPDHDVIFVFTHIMHHFFFEGIGLRQICDWCRLLWTYRDSLNYGLLEVRLQKMGLMTEWKAFAAFAVKYLGIPTEFKPIYSSGTRWERKADKICSFVIKVGDFGFNLRRDYSGLSYMTRKFRSFWGRLSDMLRHFSIFPKDSVLFFGGVLRSGLYAAVRGE